MSKWFIAGLLIFSLAPILLAQRGGEFGQVGGGFGRGGGSGHSRSRGFGRNAVFFGDPFWFDDYPSGSMANAAPAPPVVVMSQSAPAPPEPERILEPLLIEWQGDHYVRTGPSAPKVSDYSELPAVDTTRSQTAELPSAILIFRDGHREQVSDYVITGGVLYAQADYAMTGATTRDIQLAALDLSATLRANRENGSKFVLPNSPNEVVTRP